MRVAIVAVGSAGDVHPFVAVGQALRDRGHDVAIYACAWYEEVVARAGLGFEPTQSREEYLKITARPEIWDPRRAFPLIMREFVLSTARPLYERLAAEAARGAVLVSSTLDIAGRLVQERLGAPFVTAHLAPAIFRTVHRVPVFKGTAFVRRMPRWFKRGFWWFSDRHFDPSWVPLLNAFRRELGLPDVRRPMNGWWNSPKLVLGLWPPWFGPRQPDWPGQARLVGFPFYDRADVQAPDPELDRWLDDGPPPLVFTHGSANIQGAPFFRASVEACARLGARGVVVTARREDVPADLPDGMRHLPYVPFSHLLPRAAALVCHGGIGTVAQGLRSGAPQLVVPMAHDQHDNGSRLVDLGAGESLDLARYAPGTAAPILDRLMRDPAVRARCAELAGLLRGDDALGAAAAAIEGAVA